jgi:hypothetical protein
MNTKRIAPVVGVAALLLVLSGCAGVDGRFADTAHADASQARVELRLSQQRAAAAAEVAELVRGVKAAESRTSASTTRGTVDMTAQERIRAAKQAESRASGDLTRAQVLQEAAVRESLASRMPGDRMRSITLQEESVRESLESRASGDVMRAQTLEQEAVRESLAARSGDVSVQELVRSVKQAESEQ